MAYYNIQRQALVHIQIAESRYNFDDVYKIDFPQVPNTYKASPFVYHSTGKPHEAFSPFGSYSNPSYYRLINNSQRFKVIFILPY